MAHLPEPIPSQAQTRHPGEEPPRDEQRVDQAFPASPALATAGYLVVLLLALVCFTVFRLGCVAS